MTLSALILFTAIACAAVAVVAAIMLTAEMDRRGIKTPLPLIGLYIFRNLSRYREMTIAEDGKIGPLFYAYVVPINTALGLVIIAWAINGFPVS